MKNTLLRQIGLFFLGLAVVAAIFANVSAQKNGPQNIGLTDVVNKINAGEITRIEVRDNTILASGADGASFSAVKESGQSTDTVLKNLGVADDKLRSVSIEVVEPSAGALFLRSVAPTMLFLVAATIVLWFFLRQMQGANNRAMTFGQSNARQVAGDKHKVTFGDIAGNPEAKEELSEIVEFLKMPKKFSDLGAKIPKGVLLMGPPGTGKTLIARAVAGEAGVPFFHISGSEFVEMFVGVGASRVRDLFAKAQKAAPCIIFIDEIDAVGRQRGAGLGGGHDEREQTLNQILVEMDGFEPNSGVIIIAATNRPDVLDPALLRPGRFDRRVILDRPDLKDRKAILGIHAKEKPLAADVNIDRIAERTVGFAGADLANIMNEAAILAARHDKKLIDQQDLLDAIEKVMLGPERKSHILSDEERVVTAYHEAGHAIVGHVLPFCDEVHKVSIVSRGRALGYTMSLPAEDRKSKSRKEFMDELAMTLGGYVAEREIFNDFTTGASNDLQKATAIAKDLVTQYGMSDAVGPRKFGERGEMVFLGKEIHENRDYSEKTAEQIDAEINRILQEGLAKATDVIRTHRQKMDELVNELVSKETVEKERFEELFGKPEKVKPMSKREMKV